MSSFEEVQAMWDADRIAGYLALHRPEKWRLLVEEDPGWLAGHPGGFGSCDPTSVGENLRVNPARLAELVTGDGDERVIIVLDAVVVWWTWSMFQQTLQTPERQLAPLFAAEYPAAATVLALLAARTGVELHDLLVY